MSPGRSDLDKWKVIGFAAFHSAHYYFKVISNFNNRPAREERKEERRLRASAWAKGTGTREASDKNKTSERNITFVPTASSCKLLVSLSPATGNPYGLSLNEFSLAFWRLFGPAFCYFCLLSSVRVWMDIVTSAMSECLTHIWWWYNEKDAREVETWKWVRMEGSERGREKRWSKAHLRWIARS